jgi:hypothetical protein
MVVPLLKRECMQCSGSWSMPPIRDRGKADSVICSTHGTLFKSKSIRDSWIYESLMQFVNLGGICSLGG